MEIAVDNDCYTMSADHLTGERQLTFIKTKRTDNVKVSVATGDLQSHAQLTIEASDTEVVESRLLYEIYDDKLTRVGAEFLCIHGDSEMAATDTVEVRSLNDPDSLVACEPIQNASQRRWIVKKAYIDRVGSVRVERWSIRSYVDYVCSADALVDVSLGILNNVRFTKQSVEFIIQLTAPCTESVWLKDGRQIVTSGEANRKYTAAISQGGIMHTLLVEDVYVADQGIYTFKVKETTTSTRYQIEGNLCEPNVDALIKGFADLQSTSADQQ
jgi:hypothetical protein